MSDQSNPTPPPVAAGGQPTPGGSYADIFNQAATGGTAGSPGAAGTGGALGGTSTEAPPGAAASAYEYQQYVASANVTLGTQIGELLGLPTNTPIPGNQVVAALYDSPKDNLQQLEQLLYSAGFYVNVAGEPLSTSPEFGTIDNNAFMALSNAILQSANNKGASLSQIVSDRISSGAGQQIIESGLTPVTGGDNTYQVQLTNPQSVYATAYNVFEQALGRAPNQTELGALTASLQAQEKTYQQAQIGQAETASQAKYQQQLNTRAATTLPRIAGGAVPNPTGSDPGQWAVTFLQYLGDPVNEANVAALTSWIEQNGGVNGIGQNNPLGVKTQSAGATRNGQGGTDYQTAAQGLQAAAELLSSPQYAALGAALRAGNVGDAPNQDAVNSELSQWSGGKVKTLDTSTDAQTRAAQTIATANPAASTNATEAANPTARLGISGGNYARMELGPYSGSGSQPGQPQSLQDAVNATMQAAQSNPAVAAYLQAQQAAHPTVPADQLQPGQAPTSPGDAYLPANTLTQVSPPSASDAAFTAATTGANAVPYLFNQYLGAYNAIVSMIKNGGPAG